MERIPVLAILLFAVLLFSANIPALYAQPALERISVTERSDGKGFVVRYHLTTPPDSFKIAQPAPDLIQLMIYSSGIKTEQFLEPENVKGIRNIEYHRNISGFGTDIFIDENNYFRAMAYPDRNGKHLLLALERTTESDVQAIADATDFIYWYDGQDEDFAIDFRFPDDDDTFLQMRNSNGFKVIVLDAGHGGHDPGTVNRSMRLYEKDIALAVTLKLGEYIEQNIPDVKVVYTRTDDRFIDVYERGLIATRANGDLFVSIHINAASSRHARGTETFFLGLARSQSALEVMKRENIVMRPEESEGHTELTEEELLIYELANAGNMATSERIATKIESQFKNRAQRHSRGVKQAGLMALWHATMPAVLIELGFLSNPDEAQFLNSEYGQTIMASAIFRAIRDFKLEYDRSLRNNTNHASND